MKIYSYMADVPELNAEDELRLEILWRRRWSDIDIEPVVLNEHIARQHPFFAEFNDVVSRLPSNNPAAYERACWLRWLALAVVGGGWMSDFDVMPAAGVDCWNTLTFRQKEPPRSKIVVFQTPCCPALVHADERAALAFCEQAATGKFGNRPQEDKPHWSDQYALEDLVMAGVDWVEARDIVKLYTDEGWEKAPFVHFANAVMQRKNLLPRYQHIPRLLGRNDDHGKL